MGMQVINGREMAAKRGLEGQIHTLQAEIDAMLQAAKNSEEKSKKAMVDAASLADELRALEGRLADAEAAAMRGGKAAMAKLEMRIRELEAELGSVQGRTSEAMKGYQRAERKVKELQFSQDED